MGPFVVPLLADVLHTCLQWVGTHKQISLHVNCWHLMSSVWRCDVPNSWNRDVETPRTISLGIGQFDGVTKVSSWQLEPRCGKSAHHFAWYWSCSRPDHRDLQREAWHINRQMLLDGRHYGRCATDVVKRHHSEFVIDVLTGDYRCQLPCADMFTLKCNMYINILIRQ